MVRMSGAFLLVVAALGVVSSELNDTDTGYHVNVTETEPVDNVDLTELKLTESNSTTALDSTDITTKKANSSNVTEGPDLIVSTHTVNSSDATTESTPSKNNMVTKDDRKVTDASSSSLLARDFPNASSPSSVKITPTTTSTPILKTTAEPQKFESNVTWSRPEQTHVPLTLTSCEMTTERRLSVLQSPGFPSTYAPDVECRYVVKRYSLDVCSVTFLFNVFDLETSDNCHKDYVDLHGEKLCGAKTTGLTRSVPFRSSVDDQVVLRFRSDSTTSGVGFMATVVQQECPPPDCDHQFTGLKFEIRSPGFPGPYENRQLCDYTVVRAGPRICRIRLQVRVFDVEAADHCEADSLEIKGDKLCGNIPAGEIVSVDFQEPLLMIRFRSDHTTTRDGFHLLGTQEECGEDETSSNSTMPEDSAR